MKCKKIVVSLISVALIAATLVFCFSYSGGGDDMMTEGTLVSSGNFV